MELETSKNFNTIARGVMRHFSQVGLSSLSEFSPTRGLRVDIITFGMSDEIWIVECKSGQNDFKSDKKWKNYFCLLYTSPSPRDRQKSRMPSSA